jgi:hypothetical protein
MVGPIGALKDMREQVEQMARLELAMVTAYDAALRCTKTASTRAGMLAFREDHLRRWKGLSYQLQRRAIAHPTLVSDELPHPASALDHCSSEEAMLSLLRINEQELHALYERWGRSAVVPVRLRYMFRDCSAEVRRHHAWIQRCLSKVNYPSGW